MATRTDGRVKDGSETDDRILDSLDRQPAVAEQQPTLVGTRQ